jgi:Tol biopolymer transport system component
MPLRIRPRLFVSNPFAALLALLLPSVLLVATASPVSAAPVSNTSASPPAIASWQTVPLTANFTNNGQPQIDGDYVVWRAHDGVDWEIMLHYLGVGATRQLTDDGILESDPRIDGEHIVWAEHPGNRPSPNLVLYDLATGTSRPIPESEGVQDAPALRGNLVVWKVGNVTSSIYLYDIAAGSTTRLTTEDRDYSLPLTDGRYVVFDSRPAVRMEGVIPAYNPLSQVLLYDHQTKAFTRLGGDGAARPALAGGLIVWQEGNEKTAEIFLHDTATGATERLTENQVEDIAPVVGGDRVAWLEWGRADDLHMPHDSPWKVMVYDRKSGQTSVATENSLSVDMQEDGRLLVWSEWNMGPTNVAYDPAPGASANLGLATVAAFEADLDGGKVAWIGYPGFRLEDDRTLYLSALENLPPAAIPPTDPVREFADIADSPYAPAIQELAERGLARGYRTAIPLSSIDLYQLWYRPNAPTLRWQFLKMLLGVAGVDAREHTEQPPFKDVQGLEAGPDHNIRYYVQAGLDNRPDARS